MLGADEELQHFIDLVPSFSSLELMCYRCRRPARITYTYDGYMYWVSVSCHMGTIRAAGIPYTKVRGKLSLNESDVNEFKVAVREVLDLHAERTEPLHRL